MPSGKICHYSKDNDTDYFHSVAHLQSWVFQGRLATRVLAQSFVVAREISRCKSPGSNAGNTSRQEGPQQNKSSLWPTLETTAEVAAHHLRNTVGSSRAKTRLLTYMPTLPPRSCAVGGRFLHGFRFLCQTEASLRASDFPPRNPTSLGGLQFSSASNERERSL